MSRIGNYEFVMILDSQIEPEKIENEIKKIENFIKSKEGVIQSIEKWGKKRLSYEIKKRTEGIYVLFTFNVITSAIKEMEQDLRLNESVLRFLTIALTRKQLNLKKTPQEHKPSFKGTRSSYDEEDDSVKIRKIDDKEDDDDEDDEDDDDKENPKKDARDVESDENDDDSEEDDDQKIKI